MYPASPTVIAGHWHQQPRQKLWTKKMNEWMKVPEGLTGIPGVEELLAVPEIFGSLVRIHMSAGEQRLLSLSGNELQVWNS